MTNDDIGVANQRGRRHLARGPVAVEASYDLADDRVVIVLDSNVLIGFPRQMLEGLHDASRDQLERVEILGPGTAIAWDKPDVGFSVAELVSGIFGSERWMAKLGRAGSSKRSELEAAAVCRKGQEGGPQHKVSAKKSAAARRKLVKKASSRAK